MNQPAYRHIGLFINPRAGKGRALKAAALAAEKLTAAAIPFTSYTDWPEAFPAVTEAWIIGGDGTLNYFINFYPAVQVPLAIIKGGTGNDFAWKLYGDADFAAQADIILSASAKPVDAGLCNGRYYLNSNGIGFDGEVLRSMDSIRFIGGHAGYLWVVIRKLFTFREYLFKIEMPDETLEGRFLIVAVNNSSRTGGGFMVSPRASIADGLLDMMLCRKIGVLKRFRVLPLVEKGKHLDKPYIVYRQLKRVTITCEKELCAQLDGELIRATVFNLSVLPGGLRFLY